MYGPKELPSVSRIRILLATASVACFLFAAAHVSLLSAQAGMTETDSTSAPVENGFVYPNEYGLQGVVYPSEEPLLIQIIWVCS